MASKKFLSPGPLRTWSFILIILAVLLQIVSSVQISLTGHDTDTASIAIQMLLAGIFSGVLTFIAIILLVINKYKN